MQEKSPYMSADEISKYLQIPKATIYQYTMRKSIPFYKIGNRVRFTKDDIDKWVKEHKQRYVRQPIKRRKRK